MRPAATEEPRQPILAGANIAFSSGFAWPGTEAKNEGATCAGAGDERTPGGGMGYSGDGRWAMGELRMEATDEGGLRSTKPSSAQSMRMGKTMTIEVNDVWYGGNRGNRGNSKEQAR
ncbi:hypothetical protein I7I51_05635 [Histoplasma capsulatum]|uniref:Uncharacterized protein n=1 Tax=Ajellomyces capsulatus TaxID=5037 RepID=A0A8A1M4B7_AJECA|nr:hypothetical protein I7I51_05635 [Histoplasma capsulatum]